MTSSSTVTRPAPDATASVRDSAKPHFSSTRIDKLSEPSAKHPFATDRLGRDVLSRTIFGARISLLIGSVAIAMGFIGYMCDFIYPTADVYIVPSGSAAAGSGLTDVSGTPAAFQ